jgi:hypothetical protein
MRKITLKCGENEITTTCYGLSQHIYNGYVIHRLTKRGLDWYNAFPENHQPITVKSSSNCLKLDYITTDATA